MTDPVLIVSHGSPSDPETQEAAMADLAARVAALTLGRRVMGATLAAPGAFEARVADLGRPVVYPFFMADGWFVRKPLAERAAPHGLTLLPPFGMEPALEQAAASELALVLAAQGWNPAATTLLVAAHGSAVSQRNHDRTVAFATALGRRMGFSRVVAGFVEQAPRLAEVAQGQGQAVCLPFFALRAGHYLDDIPEALSEAGFTGPVLPPFVEWPATARLIAESLCRQAAAGQAPRPDARASS